MFKLCLLLTILRYYVKSIVGQYDANADQCKQLVQLANATEVDAVRNAYCVEIVDMDNKILNEAMYDHYAGAIAWNVSYQSADTVIETSCKMPEYVYLILDWTSGIGIMMCVWMVQKFRRRRPSTMRIEIPEESEEDVDEGPPPGPPKMASGMASMIQKRRELQSSGLPPRYPERSEIKNTSPRKKSPIRKRTVKKKEDPASQELLGNLRQFLPQEDAPSIDV